MYTGGGYSTNSTDGNSDAAVGTGLRISVFTEASRNLILLKKVGVSDPLRVQIQHFMSIRIRIQIQGFDDQKEKSSALKRMNFFLFFVCGSFSPFWIRIWIQEGKSMRIRIRNTSKTLYRGHRPGGSRIHPK
jgi:hypothetical protein